MGIPDVTISLPTDITASLFVGVCGAYLTTRAIGDTDQVGTGIDACRLGSDLG